MSNHGNSSRFVQPDAEVMSGNCSNEGHVVAPVGLVSADHRFEPCAAAYRSPRSHRITTLDGRVIFNGDSNEGHVLR